jgi:basic membrane protein A
VDGHAVERRILGARRRGARLVIGATALCLLSLGLQASVAGAGGDEDPCIRVAFVYENETDTPGFEASQKTGEEYLAENLPCAEITSVESVAEGPGSEQTFTRLAEEGNDLIFGLSFGYGDQILAVAEDYPDTTFEWALGFQRAKNVGNFYGAKYEGWYLAGIAAGQLSETGKLGYVAPFAIPSIINDLNGFTLGARSVNPDATVQVVYANDFEDPVKDKQSAEALVDDGVDFLAQSSGSPSVGEVATTENLWWSGVDDPRIESFGPETFVSASRLNWGVYFLKVAQDVVDGDWKSRSYFGTFEDGFAAITLGANVPPDVVAEVQQAETQLQDGSLQVFEGPIRNQKGKVVVKRGKVASRDKMASFLVEGVKGKIPAED